MTNCNLVFMQEYLNYKNMDKMRVLLTKLLYSEIIWWTRSLSIYLIITDLVSKDITLAIQVLISHQCFASHLMYILFNK